MISFINRFFWLTQKLWDDTHIRIDARKRKTKGVEENIFRGLLKCDDCGGTMRITSPLNKKMFFVCANSKKRVGGAELCSTHNIQYDVLYDAVLKDIRSVLEQFNKDEKAFRKYVLDSISEVSCDAEKLSESIAELDIQIDREKKKYKRLYDDYYSGIIKDPEMFEEMTSDCAERKEILSARREALVKELNSGKCYVDDTEKFLAVLRECFIIDKLDKETLNKLVQKITVGEKRKTDGKKTVQKVKIFYRFVGNFCEKE